MTHAFALPEPKGIEGAADDGSVAEVARVWVNKEMPAIMVRPLFQDPRAMGQMLAEVCWNFAAAYAERDGTTQAEALELLKAGWRNGHALGAANLAKGTPQ